MPWKSFVLHGLFASAKVVLLPTLLFGAGFPLVARIVTSSAASADADVGRALAMNTAAAIAGAVAGGFVILPFAGLVNGIRALSYAGIFALFAAIVACGTDRKRLGGLGGAGLIVIILAGIAAPYSGEAIQARALTRGSSRDKLLYYEDSAESSVGVVEDNKTTFRILYVNGDAQASTDPGGMLHLRLLGHLPALLHANPRSGLVICCGAGVTLGSLASHPIESLEICDISAAILKLNKDGWFDSGNGGVFKDPRLRVTVDDGRNHLLSTGRSYDVITTDPIDPDDAGVTSIYSLEFYQLVERRLNPGGVACQWMTTQYSIDVYKSLVQAFRSVFPESFIYDADFTTVLVGRKSGGAPVPFARLEDAFADAKISASLAEVGVDDPYDLLSLQIAGPAELAAFCAGAPPNCDAQPIAEVVAPKTIWGQMPGAAIEKLKSLIALRNENRGDFVADWTAVRRASFEPAYGAMTRVLASRLFSRKNPDDTIPAAIAKLATFGPDAPEYVDLMAGFDKCEFEKGEDRIEFDKLFYRGRDFLLSDLNDPAQAAAAAREFTKALELRRDSPRALYGLALAAAHANDPAGAIDAVIKLVRRARYSEYTLSGFCKIQVDRLIDAAGDSVRAEAAVAALDRLFNHPGNATKDEWRAWWDGNKTRARLDAEQGRFIISTRGGD